MAGRYNLATSAATTKSRSRVLLLFALSLLVFTILFLFSSLSPNHSSSSSSAFDPSRFQNLNSYPNPIHAETSFVLSLENFLVHKAPKSPLVKDDTVSFATDNDNDDLINKLDDSIYVIEQRRLHGDPYYPVTLPLRIYVYDMPYKLTYDLLWLFRNTYKQTSNVTSNGSPVHRLIEQHSIDYWLWADLIAPESGRLLKSVVRVHRQEEADLFYIPLFTTISFFLLEKQQCKALYRVKL